MRRRHWNARVFDSEQLDQALEVGIVGHWIGGPGSGSGWNDRSGYRNHATFNGAPKWVLDQKQSRYAVSTLTPSTDYLSVAASASLNNLGALTLAAWVYPINFASTQTILNKMNAGATTGWTLALTGAGAVEYYRFGTSGPNDNGYTTSDGLVIANAWIHIAFVTPGAGTSGTFYLNGASVAQQFTSPGGATSDDSANSLLIANQIDDLTTVMIGILDDVRVYGRALSSGEIARLANPSFQAVLPLSRRNGASPAVQIAAVDALLSGQIVGQVWQ